jgi:hypothetical protein
MLYSQISEYAENRLSLMIHNVGPDAFYMSTDIDDVTQPEPIGIYVASRETRTFDWQTHGELVWQRWYANCTRSQILTWVWVGYPTPVTCVLTPVRSKFDIVPCKPLKPRVFQPPTREKPDIRQRVFLYQMMQGIRCPVNASEQ